MLIVARFDVQSLGGPVGFPRPGGPVTVLPFSTRVQPGCAMMIEPSCVVIPSK